MINILLNLSDEDRIKLISKIKPETKKRIFDNILKLTEILNLDQVKDYEERVRLRSEYIAKYPEKTHWDFAEYDNNTTVLVSDKGDALTISKNNCVWFILRKSKGKNNYTYIRLKGKQISLHVAIGRTFIPIPERLNNESEICINHKDQKRYNNNVNNLEWVSYRENSRHCSKHSDYLELECFIFECIVDNGFLGRKFIFTHEDRNFFKTPMGEIRNISNGDHDYIFRGFKVTKTSEKDISKYHYGIPEDIKALYNKDFRYFSYIIKPIIGTILSGDNAGKSFSLFGENEANDYFVKKSISNVINGKATHHKGCSFRFGTVKEAIPLHGKVGDFYLKRDRSQLLPE